MRLSDEEFEKVATETLKLTAFPYGDADEPEPQALIAEAKRARASEAKQHAALERVRQDINWMLNNREFLNPDVFDYLDEVIP